MKHVKIIASKDTLREADNLMIAVMRDHQEEVSYSRDTIDCSNRNSVRIAKRIINEYAVTKLPFVVISDEEGEYATVYSEEGPITADRVNEKL